MIKLAFVLKEETSIAFSFSEPETTWNSYSLSLKFNLAFSLGGQRLVRSDCHKAAKRNPELRAV